MSANLKRLLALVLWAEVVLILAYWKWWPRPLDHGDLREGELAFILRLPEEGILTRMIDRDVMVSLAMPEQPRPLAAEAALNKPLPVSPAKTDVLAKKTPPQVLSQVAPAAPSTSIVEHARVLDRICRVEIQSTTRIAVCYAMIAVPRDRMAALASAPDKVSVWVEGK